MLCVPVVTTGEVVAAGLKTTPEGEGKGSPHFVTAGRPPAAVGESFALISHIFFVSVVSVIGKS